MNALNIIKSVIKVELFLSITLCLLPILLPVTSGQLLNSISQYASSEASWLYVVMLSLISILLIYDGFKDKTRRFNIALGISLLGVVSFPVSEYRLLHDIFAILFFLENVTVLTYFSKIFSKTLKIFLTIVTGIVLTLFFLGYITLFTAEAIGVMFLGIFFFMRYLKV